jgi:hypothetical protein
MWRTLHIVGVFVGIYMKLTNIKPNNKKRLNLAFFIAPPMIVVLAQSLLFQWLL